jgi:hypothetical protein
MTKDFIAICAAMLVVGVGGGACEAIRMALARRRQKQCGPSPMTPH